MAGFVVFLTFETLKLRRCLLKRSARFRNIFNSENWIKVNILNGGRLRSSNLKISLRVSIEILHLKTGLLNVNAIDSMSREKCFFFQTFHTRDRREGKGTLYQV